MHFNATFTIILTDKAADILQSYSRTVFKVMYSWKFTVRKWLPNMLASNCQRLDNVPYKSCLLAKYNFSVTVWELDFATMCDILLTWCHAGYVCQILEAPKSEGTHCSFTQKMSDSNGQFVFCQYFDIFYLHWNSQNRLKDTKAKINWSTTKMCLFSNKKESRHFIWLQPHSIQKVFLLTIGQSFHIWWGWGLKATKKKKRRVNKSM